MGEAGAPKDEFDPVVARWVWWAISLVVLGWLALKLDWVQRVVNTEDYWKERTADARTSVEVAEFMLKDFKIDAERHSRTVELDVAQAVESARLGGMSIDDAEEEAIEEARLTAKINRENIEFARDSLSEAQSDLKRAEQEQANARAHQPEEERQQLIAICIVIASGLWTAFFKTHWWVGAWGLTLGRLAKGRSA